MRTLEDGEILFSETDLISMGINRHDAKKILYYRGIAPTWKSTRRNFISEYELEQRLETYGMYLVHDRDMYRIIGRKNT